MISIDIAAPTYTLHHELSSATVLGLRQFLPLAPHPSPIFSPVEDTPQTIMDPLGFSSGTIDPRKVFVMTPPASLKLPYDFSQAPRKIHIPRANGLHSPVISPTFVNRLGSNDPGAYTDYCNLTEGRMANFGDSGNESPEAYDSRSSFDSASSSFWGIDSPTPSIYGETSETCASPSTMSFEFCERTLESSLTNNMNSKEFSSRGDMGTDGAGLDKDVVDSSDESATDGETVSTEIEENTTSESPLAVLAKASFSPSTTPDPSSPFSPTTSLSLFLSATSPPPSSVATHVSAPLVSIFPSVSVEIVSSPSVNEASSPDVSTAIQEPELPQEARCFFITLRWKVGGSDEEESASIDSDPEWIERKQCDSWAADRSHRSLPAKTNYGQKLRKIESKGKIAKPMREGSDHRKFLLCDNTMIKVVPEYAILAEFDIDQYPDSKIVQTTVRRGRRAPTINMPSAGNNRATKRQRAGSKKQKDTFASEGDESTGRVRQHACRICGGTFGRREHLKRHFRSVHTAERPYVCKVCNKGFSRCDNLVQHVKTHDEGYV